MHSLHEDHQKDHKIGAGYKVESSKSKETIHGLVLVL
jgi:hypothetical protein